MDRAENLPERNRRPIWGVGALLRALADALQARFNPVTVRGEVTGYSRAASGHCYFSLKDEAGQIRCAMFRRAAQGSNVTLRDGQLVEATGKLDIYGPRGDLQLIVDQVQLAGQGGLFEQFMRMKAELEAQGLFDPARKRPLPVFARSVGVVTSLDAAALRDVLTALKRRVPHLPVTIFPAPVQGDSAPMALCQALDQAYQAHLEQDTCDVLLLVRGGGSLEDLWAFNSPHLVRKLAQAPMPVVCGVGHETDFTLADFVADVRAATPTAAAEICAPARETQLQSLGIQASKLLRAGQRLREQHAQRLDRLAQRLGRPGQRLGQEAARLQTLQHRLHVLTAMRVQRERQIQQRWVERLPTAVRTEFVRRHQALNRLSTRLEMLDPRHVLQRGYAWLANAEGHAVTSVSRVLVGDDVVAVLADGELGLTVHSAKN